MNVVWLTVCNLTFESYADCLMTSGAIQKGVPTKVLRLICVSVSWPATPKSASFTSPCSDSSTLAAVEGGGRTEWDAAPHLNTLLSILLVCITNVFNNKETTVKSLLVSCCSVHINSPLTYKLSNEWKREWMSIPLTCYVIFRVCSLLSFSQLKPVSSNSSIFTQSSYLWYLCGSSSQSADTPDPWGSLSGSWQSGSHPERRAPSLQQKTTKKKRKRKKIWLISDSDSILSGY